MFQLYYWHLLPQPVVIATTLRSDHDSLFQLAFLGVEVNARFLKDNSSPNIDPYCFRVDRVLIAGGGQRVGVVRMILIEWGVYSWVQVKVRMLISGAAWSETGISSEKFRVFLRFLDYFLFNLDVQKLVQRIGRAFSPWYPNSCWSYLAMARSSLHIIVHALLNQIFVFLLLCFLLSPPEE